MTRGTIFWVLMIIWLVFGVWVYWPASGSTNYAPIGGSLLQFALFFLLGWKVFGFIISDNDSPPK